MKLKVAALVVWLFTTGLAQDTFAGTEAESQALQSINADELVKARELARAILKDSPKSFAGHFVLGYTFHNSEGDLPKAKFHIEKSMQLFVEQHGANFPMESPWGWYEKDLLELIQINAEMDQYQEQIKALDTYLGVSKRLFNQEPPTILVSYAWPLMKLEKEQEARAKLELVANIDEEIARSTYLNTLGAMEMEFDHPQASYQAFKTLLEEVDQKGWRQTSTYLRNLGEASATLGKYEEAERLYTEATRYFEPYTYSNPWFDLTFLYASQGRFAEAVDALKETHRWRSSVKSFLAQQTWAQDMHITAELLLHLGETEKAFEIAEMITERPDRQGGDSIQSDQKEAGTLMLYRSVATAQANLLKESLTWKSGWHWWKAQAYRGKVLNDIRLADIKIRALSSNHKRLSASLRPYYSPGTFVMTDWHRPDLVDVYGAGVAAEALSGLFEKQGDNFENQKSVLEVIKAEIKWYSGDEDEAIEILKKVIPTLADSRAVLRARAEARLAGILFEEGRFEEALEYGTRVLDTAPAMFRHLELSVPVRIETDGDAACLAAGKALAKSPRFHRDERGYPIKISKRGDKLVASLASPQNALLAEVQVSAQAKVPEKPVETADKDKDKDKESEEEEEILSPSNELVATFHKKAFSPRLDLSQSDVNSLDGSTTSDSRRNNDARQVLGLPSLAPGARPEPDASGQ